MSLIQENLTQVKERIARAAKRVGRAPEQIQLVTVSKTIPPEKIQEAVDAGVTHIGENRVQEAAEKRPHIKGSVRWHLVGHLQRNKVKQALELFDLIHSVDSVRLLDELEKRSAQMEQMCDVLVQVNTSQESTKSGLAPEDVLDFIKLANEYPHIRVQGLMTIGPFVENPELARPCFRQLRELRNAIMQLALPRIEMKYLSMGMTSDFEVAIEEGANLVRIGTAIFGTRH